MTVTMTSNFDTMNMTFSQFQHPLESNKDQSEDRKGHNIFVC